MCGLSSWMCVIVDCCSTHEMLVNSISGEHSSARTIYHGGASSAKTDECHFTMGGKCKMHLHNRCKWQKMENMHSHVQRADRFFFFLNTLDVGRNSLATHNRLCAIRKCLAKARDQTHNWNACFYPLFSFFSRLFILECAISWPHENERDSLTTCRQAKLPFSHRFCHSIDWNHCA